MSFGDEPANDARATFLGNDFSSRHTGFLHHFYHAHGGLFCIRRTTQAFCSIIFAPVVYFMVGFSTADSRFRFFTFIVTGDLSWWRQC